jgi:hypothetical protein
MRAIEAPALPQHTVAAAPQRARKRRLSPRMEVAGVGVLNETLNINFIPVSSSQSAWVAGAKRVPAILARGHGANAPLPIRRSLRRAERPRAKLGAQRLEDGAEPVDQFGTILGRNCRGAALEVGRGL